MQVPKLQYLQSLPLRSKLILAGVAGLVVIGLTLTAAWYLWGRGAAKVPDSKPAEAVSQADGSVVLEKKPDPARKPVHKTPPGSVVEREVSTTVEPYGPPDLSGLCPKVTVNLSLVRNPDKTKRVVASSPDGKVVGGLDVPVDDAIPPPAPKLWAAGGAYSSKGEAGAFLDRDLGWSRLGVQLNEVKEGGSRAGWEGWIKAGIRF